MQFGAMHFIKDYYIQKYKIDIFLKKKVAFTWIQSHKENSQGFKSHGLIVRKKSEIPIPKNPEIIPKLIKMKINQN